MPQKSRCLVYTVLVGVAHYPTPLYIANPIDPNSSIRAICIPPGGLEEASSTSGPPE
jgi:hypothetical protein